LGKIGNCQIGVSVHAVGAKGTVPLGWALYLPEDWCADPERRQHAKIPEEVGFKTKPELGVELVELATGWELPAGPVLGDQAYGDDSKLRERLDGAGREYVLSLGPKATAFAPETVFAVFAVPERNGAVGRSRRRLRPDREPESMTALIARLGPESARSVTFRDGPRGRPTREPRLCVRGVFHWPRSPRPTPASADGSVVRREMLLSGVRGGPKTP
jgi:hypothetical protein